MDFIIEIMVAVMFTGAVAIFIMGKVNKKDEQDLWGDSRNRGLLINDQKYNTIAINMLHNGNDYQRECIKWYMQNTTGRNRLWAIKRFIDIQTQFGKVEG